MVFCDLALARRLERAEGQACVQFAEARRRQFPDRGAEWMECGGAYAVFDGAESPVTQSFGLGVFEELTAATLDAVERFFFDRGAAANHEVSPLAGVAALDLLCSRGYKPIEISSVMVRPVENRAATTSNIRVRRTGPEEAELWARINARGWVEDHPEFLEFVLESGTISALRPQGWCFLAEMDGVPGAAGGLFIHEGVALFAGAATVPEMRRRGLQAALFEARMRAAYEQGCELAMMAAEAGSGSQRNAQRQGFQIAYTRTKWQLSR